MAGLFVKKGDTVIVRSGKDRGARGKVLLTLPKDSRVLVEGVNRVKKHTKVTTTQRGAQAGGIVTQEAPVHVSNVQVVCPNCSKPTRVVVCKNDDGRSVLTFRMCGGDVCWLRPLRPWSGTCRDSSSVTATRSWVSCANSSVTPTSCRSRRS
jgi:large subunit ribosomal protein L24